MLEPAICVLEFQSSRAVDVIRLAFFYGHLGVNSQTFGGMSLQLRLIVAFSLGIHPCSLRIVIDGNVKAAEY